MPALPAIGFFIIAAALIYVIILAFSLLTAPLFVRFRDLSMIWDVMTSLLFYATPIFYSLQMMPDYIQRILLINPMAFIIHFTKEALINNHYPEVWQTSLFLMIIAAAFGIGVFSYRKLIPKIAEEI